MHQSRPPIISSIPCMANACTKPILGYSMRWQTMQFTILGRDCPRGRDSEPTWLFSERHEENYLLDRRIEIEFIQEDYVFSLNSMVLKRQTFVLQMIWFASQLSDIRNFTITTRYQWLDTSSPFHTSKNIFPAIRIPLCGVHTNSPHKVLSTYQEEWTRILVWKQMAVCMSMEADGVKIFFKPYIIFSFPLSELWRDWRGEIRIGWEWGGWEETEVVVGDGGELGEERWNSDENLVLKTALCIV